MRRGLEGLDRFMVEDRDDRHDVVGAPRGAQPAPGSLPVAGLGHRAGDASRSATPGLPGEHPALLARRRVAARRGGHRARRLVGRAARPAPGGWAFEFANVNYPDVDDTAEVVLALQRARPPARSAAGVRAQRDRSGAHRRASRVRWVEGMQSSRRRLGRLRRRQHALARARAAVPGLRRGDRRAERRRDRPRGRDARRARARRDAAPRAAACAGCSTQQEPDGSWFGRWGVNHVYGTGAAVPGADRRRGRARRRRASAARCAGSSATRTKTAAGARTRAPTTTPRWIGRGPSTASQTAWALLALHAAGERSQALARGVAWLVATQRADGSWDEPQYTGTGFPSDYYINYHLYRLDVPGDGARALPRRRGRRGAPSGGRRAARGVLRDSGDAAGGAAPRRAAAVMARADGENFPVASRLLPRRVRAHLLAIYGFARLVDELGDAPPGRPPGGARLARGGARPRPSPARRRAPAAGARWQPTLRECALPREPFVRLIEANRVDQRVSRYETWEQLRGYCAPLRRPRRRARAGRLRRRRPPSGSRSRTRSAPALQLAEHWQDVAEDLARGRVYLPLEDLARFGCTTTDLAAAHAGGPLRAVLAFEVARARELLRRGRAAARRAARAGPARGRRLRRRRARGARGDRARRLRRARRARRAAARGRSRWRHARARRR